MILVYAMAILGGFHAGLTGSVWSVYFWMITAVMIFVAWTRLYFKKKDKTNWDISDRKKRIIPLLVLLVVVGCIYAVLVRVADPRIASLFGAFFIWIVGFFVLTLKIKLSGHVAILTWVFCHLIAWFGYVLLPIGIVIPILAWSRLALKRHTVLEVIVGFLYSILVFFVSSRIIG